MRNSTEELIELNAEYEEAFPKPVELDGAGRSWTELGVCGSWWRVGMPSSRSLLCTGTELGTALWVHGRGSLSNRSVFLKNF